MTETPATIPTCPGCHFGCLLDDYQCGRGAKFSAKWQMGEPIPERRRPGMPPRDAEGEGRENPGNRPGRPPHLAHVPASARCMMLLAIAQKIMRDREDEARSARVGECIARQDGSATNRIIAERTHLTDGQIDEQIAVLEGQGFVASRVDGRGRTFHELTEKGLEQAQTWLEEHKAADAAFFSELDDDELEQLETLLAKALHPHMARRR